jgi:hypothetical protein
MKASVTGRPPDLSFLLVEQARLGDLPTNN